MIILTITATLALASADLAASAERSALSTCLKASVESAKAAKIEPTAFDAYMHSQCASQEDGLRKAVIAIDVKNGISRKDATENADLDVGDYFAGTAERYEYELGAAQPE